MANNITDEEITRLAREYAEEVTKADVGGLDLPDSELEDIREAVSDYAEDVLQWLLRSHCLVEKSKIREEYRDAQKDQYNPERDFALTLAGRNRSAVLETLFGDTLKEEGV